MFVDKASGAIDQRPRLAEVIDQLRPGDTLVVWRLDRLGRSLRHLIETIGELQERGVGFRSLQENIDTTTPGGKLVFHIFGALAEFERDLIRGRTAAGLAAARARGRNGGRPGVMSARKVAVARQMHDSREHTVSEIAKVLGVSRASIYRHLGRGKGHAFSKATRTPDAPNSASNAAGLSFADRSRNAVGRKRRACGAGL